MSYRHTSRNPLPDFRLLYLFRFGFRQSLAGLADEGGEVVAVVDIDDVEVRLCTLVWRLQIKGSEQRPTRLRRFDIESVVTDKPEDFPITIDAVVAKHLLGDNRPRPTTLVEDVLHKVRIASHNPVPI